MRFWDTSAIVPLIVEEPMSEAMKASLGENREITVWWATWVECVAALARRSREGDGENSAAERSRAKLKTLADGWVEIQPTPKLRSLAGRPTLCNLPRPSDGATASRRGEVS